MNPMFEAGVETGREQGLDSAMDCIMERAEYLSGESLVTALDLHRRLMAVRFPKSNYAEVGAKLPPNNSAPGTAKIRLPRTYSPTLARSATATS